MNVEIHPAEKALEIVLSAFKGDITSNDISVSASIYPHSLRHVDPGSYKANLHWGHRDKVGIYPASLMKLFLLAVFVNMRNEGSIDNQAEDDRACEAMIRKSSNEATVYLMGRVTGAEDGSCLPVEALAEWCSKRAFVQNWFNSKSEVYEGISLLHATYHDSPYGRAKQARTSDNANQLSAAASAHLMHDIARGALAGSTWMLDLLDRDFQRKPDYANAEADQVRGFLAEGLPNDVKVWSKAGHTSGVRHDLLYGELPDGIAFILSVMTEGEWTSRNEKFLPEFARAFYRAVFDKNQN